MGTLNVNQLNADIIRDSDGVTRHTPISMSMKGASSIITNITWHTSYSSTTQNLGDLSSYTTSQTYAVSIIHHYTHGGSTNHGYLTGYVFQKGKNYATHGAYTDQTHYDWYYNKTATPLLVPWDPNGDQMLQIYVTNAYNSSSSNVQAFFMGAIHEKEL